ncbi:invasion associated locus B family protein [Bombella sp. TMW 2.2559]|uniref:Invasion associated locus B family protein n=1 Tax=Bombella dulcis TaxID=2967339 RepID=A0ABT3WGM4_9PROT|nr:invasion associated locus B family protein [Bombella dulcis]MCX5616919.1 invasion associated locus B family protein [Bombella dulcis]
MVQGQSVMGRGMKIGRLLGGLCGLTFLLGASAHATLNLSNNPSVLLERYQDWQVVCQTPSAVSGGRGKQCFARQQVLDSQSHRLVMSIRLEPDGVQVRGLVTVPFGLDLVRGVTLTNASEPVGDSYAFSTCLPMGCFVPLSFDERQWSTLLKEKRAVLTAMTFSGQPMKLFFSTQGLAHALQRIRVLTQQ